MHCSRVLTGLLVLCLAGTLAPWTSADESLGKVSKEKVPEAKKTLAGVLKHLSKATEKQSFNIDCNVQGGVSKTPDHQLHTTSVATRYTAEVYRGMMKVTTDNEAYRTPTKGAVRNKATNAWQDALSTNEGRQMARLLSFPHEVLQKALAKSEKVEWVWVGDEEPIGGAAEQPAEEASAPEEVPEGTTRVNPESNPGATTEEVVKMPHLARVTLSQEVALNFWNETKNSGCVSGG